MSKPKVEATLEFTWKELISTIVSILVLVLIGYDVKDLINLDKTFDNISITLIICGIFAFVYMTMLFVKFGKESKILADYRNEMNKRTFEDGVITVKKEKEIPVILPRDEEEKKS
jgi:hypothetical protein